jgi:hypothetical protein
MIMTLMIGFIDDPQYILPILDNIILSNISSF